MPDGDDVLRCLAALQRSQATWLADLSATCPHDPAFTDAFRRWQEQLTQVKLHLHRSEGRLLHFVLSPQAAALHRDVRGAEDPGRTIARAWRHRLQDWFSTIHLDPTYARLESVRDLSSEPVNADIITDFTILAELAEQTAPVLERIALDRDLGSAQDLAFFGVLAPWRVRGLPALHDCLRWLAETLSDEGDW